MSSAWSASGGLRPPTNPLTMGCCQHQLNFLYCNVNDRLFRLYSPDGGAAPVNGGATYYTIGADTDEKLGAKCPAQSAGKF